MSCDSSFQRKTLPLTCDRVTYQLIKVQCVTYQWIHLNNLSKLMMRFFSNLKNHIPIWLQFFKIIAELEYWCVRGGVGICAAQAGQHAFLSTDGTSVSLWWKCLSTPFIYTLFYIIYIIYTFGYFTHTDYTQSLPCVLFIICVLCVFYDSIHVLNVYVLFRAISSSIHY